MRFLCITLRECIRVYVCDGCGNGCEEGAARSLGVLVGCGVCGSNARIPLTIRCDDTVTELANYQW